MQAGNEARRKEEAANPKAEGDLPEDFLLPMCLQLLE